MAIEVSMVYGICSNSSCAFFRLLVKDVVRLSCVVDPLSCTCCFC
ncbi:hypothetical protein ERO13_D05G320720v2 [Gossypium hirsutum]|nr:hypothetical protein ERO13_D05G320720v2 [Gossypium hirsutum]